MIKMIWFDDGVELQDGRKVSDIEAIKAIKKHKTKKTVYGIPMLDYGTFPKVSYKPVDIAKEDIYETIKKRVQKERFIITPYGKRIKEKYTDKIITKKLRFKKGEKMGEDGIEMTSMFSIMLGAIKELSNRIDKLENK